MLKENIIAAINMTVGASDFESWRVGLTCEPEGCKAYWRDAEKENTKCWSVWQADSVEEAQAIAAHFIENGMNGGAWEELSLFKTAYVYIF